MKPLDGLLASYLDLARHLDPLRHPHEAPETVRHALGRFDPPWLRAQVAALRAIANAIEDLEDVEALDDEVDRTMLLNTIRFDVLRLESLADATLANPVVPLGHAVRALRTLMTEHFTGDDEAALRDRVAALPDLLSTVNADTRAVAPHLLAIAGLELETLDDAVDEASERLDEAAVQPAVAAIEACRRWLDDPARVAEPEPMPESILDAILSTMVSEPVGHRGTLRILELRRTGVERLLAAAAADLGADDGLTIAQALRDEDVAIDDSDDAWADEWRRVGTELDRIGFDVPEAEVPSLAYGTIDNPWSFTAQAIRDRAAVMLDAARARQLRPVRRLLVAPGLVSGWGRTVAALLKPSEVAGTPERRVMISHRALVECAAAEIDLLMLAQATDIDALQARVEALTGLDPDAARKVVLDTAAAPFHALSAALAHEAWQGWYAEEGGDPVAFLRRVSDGGGLAVPLARWALSASTPGAAAAPVTDGLI